MLLVFILLIDLALIRESNCDSSNVTESLWSPSSTLQVSNSSSSAPQMSHSLQEKISSPTTEVVAENSSYYVAISKEGGVQTMSVASYLSNSLAVSATTNSSSQLGPTPSTPYLTPSMLVQHSTTGSASEGTMKNTSTIFVLAVSRIETSKMAPTAIVSEVHSTNAPSFKASSLEVESSRSLLNQTIFAIFTSVKEVTSYSDTREAMINATRAITQQNTVSSHWMENSASSIEVTPKMTALNFSLAVSTAKVMPPSATHSASQEVMHTEITSAILTYTLSSRGVMLNFTSTEGVKSSSSAFSETSVRETANFITPKVTEGPRTVSSTLNSSLSSTNTMSVSTLRSYVNSSSTVLSSMEPSSSSMQQSTTTVRAPPSSAISASESKVVKTSQRTSSLMLSSTYSSKLKPGDKKGGSRKLSISAKIGIIVAVSIILLIMLLVVILCYRKRTTKNQFRYLDDFSPAPGTYSSIDPTMVQMSDLDQGDYDRDVSPISGYDNVGLVKER